MNNKKKLLTALVALVIVVTFAGIARLLWIGTQLTQGESPFALAAAPDGGFVLATDRRLLEFNHAGILRHSRSAAELGVQEPGAVQFAPDGALWLFDRGTRRLFECRDLPCSARSDAALGLDQNALFALSPAHDLVAISDNNRHRLLLLDRAGKLLLDSGNTPPLHYPNQLVFDGDSLVIADSDRYVILRIPVITTPRLTLGTPQRLQDTHRRPYRFAPTGDGWRVLEAGSTLFHGELVSYGGDGERRVLRSTAADPVDFLARDDHLIVASREDRRLLRIDTASGRETALGPDGLQTQWQAMAARERALLRERRLLPTLMLLVLMPLLLVALLLQLHARRQAAEQVEAAVDAGLVAALRAGRPVRLVPDAEGLKTIRQERNTVFGVALAGLVLVPGVCWLIAGAPSLVAFRSLELRDLLLVVLATVPLLAGGLVLGVVQYRRRLSRVLCFSPSGVELQESGKVKASAPWSEVRLEQGMLMLGRFVLPLYLNPLQRLSPFWPRAQIRALVEVMQPPPASVATVDGELHLQPAEADLQRLRRLRLLLRILAGAGTLFCVAFGVYVASRLSTGFLPRIALPLAGMAMLYLFLGAYMERFYGRLIGTRLVLRQGSLTVLEGSTTHTVPYAQVWLGENILVAGDRGVRIAMRRNNLSQQVIELFPVDRLRDELRQRLPADHLFATDVALHLALLRQRQRYGVLAALRVAGLVLFGIAMLVFDRYLEL